MSSICSDNHIHPFERIKTKASMRSFAEIAKAKGLEKITFTEHAPHIAGLCSHGLTLEELEAYVAYTKELQKEINFVEIKLGIEADWHISNLDFLNELINKYHFDYVLGSIHMHSDIYRDEISKMEMKEIGDLAFKYSIEAVESGLFDAIAHLDFFRWLNDQKRFGIWQEEYTPHCYEEICKKLFNLMMQKKVLLEINSSGLNKNFQSILPSKVILNQASQYDLKYIYGSDAHSPDFVAYGQNEVLNALKLKQKKNLVDFKF